MCIMDCEDGHPPGWPLVFMCLHLCRESRAKAYSSPRVMSCLPVAMDDNLTPERYTISWAMKPEDRCLTRVQRRPSWTSTMTGDLCRAAGRLTSKQVDGAPLVAGTRPAGVATFS
jgi:hypothetical protein